MAAYFGIMLSRFSRVYLSMITPLWFQNSIHNFNLFCHEICSCVEKFHICSYCRKKCSVIINNLLLQMTEKWGKGKGKEERLLQTGTRP